MNDNWEIKNFQRQLDRLEDAVARKTEGITTPNFIWLVVLSNLLFLGFIAHIGLKRDVNKISQQYELNACNIQPTKEHNKT